MTNKIVYFPTNERKSNEPALPREIYLLDREVQELRAVIAQATPEQPAQARY
jgi:hypothetical protein